MVLADGSYVTANDQQNQDLFWAVRGGGGNFGVVTSFTFRLHPVSTVMAGPIFYAVEDAPAVMKAYERFITTAPEDISGFFAFLVVPPRGRWFEFCLPSQPVHVWLTAKLGADVPAETSSGRCCMGAAPRAELVLVREDAGGPGP
jgi:hypothetical protein